MELSVGAFREADRHELRAMVDVACEIAALHGHHRLAHLRARSKPRRAGPKLETGGPGQEVGPQRR